MSRPRKPWPPILERAADLVDESPTGVTLRQVFYLLVAEGLIDNLRADYKKLSELSARARRRGDFPPLLDLTRTVERLTTFASPREALDRLAHSYRRDLLEGQVHLPVIVVEKATLVAQMVAAFGGLGVPVTALRGYASETLEARLLDLVSQEQRGVTLLYVGDFDPSGEDIPRAFTENTGLDLQRVALTPAQVETYDLPPAPGKRSDSRALGFEERHGRLVQVEVEALPPEALRGLVTDALDTIIDYALVDAARGREDADRRRLRAMVDAWPGEGD